MTTRGDWTTPAQLSEQERTRAQFEKMIFENQNSRDSAITLVLVSLGIAHKERTAMPLFLDLLDSCLKLVRHESEREASKFLREHLDQVPAEYVGRFLELFEHRCGQASLEAGRSAKKLVALISEHTESDSEKARASDAGDA